MFVTLKPDDTEHERAREEELAVEDTLALVEHPGWLRFSGWCAAQQSLTIQQLKLSKTGEEALKLSAQLKVWDDVLGRPMSFLKASGRELK